MGENTEMKSEDVQKAVAAEAAADTHVDSVEKWAAAPAIRPEARRIAADKKRYAFFTASALALAVVIASSVSISLYQSSRHNADQKIAFWEFQQSLHRMEQRLAIQQHNVGEAGPGVNAGSSLPGSPASGESGSMMLLDAANLHYREGQFPAAVISFRAAAKRNIAGQFSDETHYCYAHSLLKTGEADAALAEFQAVVSGFPGSPYFAAAAMETANLLVDKGNYVQARRMLYQLIAARDRLSASDKDCVERAHFLVARCFEAEAQSFASK